MDDRVPGPATDTHVCTVVFFDIVEFSRQPVSQQASLKARCQAMVSHALRNVPATERIVLETGDGAAMCFWSSLKEPLFVAKRLRDGGEVEPRLPGLALRIGMSHGPVTILKNSIGQHSISGEALTDAKRVMSLARPTQILAARSYRDAVTSRAPEYAQYFSPLGSRPDKALPGEELFEVGGVQSANGATGMGSAGAGHGATAIPGSGLPPTKTEATKAATTVATLVEPHLPHAPANPRTGATKTSPNTEYFALPQGYMLHEYRIESVLGGGGFGLTYLAHDAHLNCKVAVKEFFPSNIVVRVRDQSVHPRSTTVAESFQEGLQNFLDEARVLATFHHPNIVRVRRFFETNRTAYMVMEYEQGNPLQEWVRLHGPLDRAGVLRIVLPLMDGLEVVHASGFLHRDIKPGNIYIRGDESPVLLDFGSARHLSSRSGQTLTSIISPGYAPFEQYHSHGNQGPWGDVYSLGAVMYWMVTGKKPLDAASRVRKDTMPPALELADQSLYGEPLLRAIGWALEPDEGGRPQSILAFRNAITNLSPRPDSGAMPTAVAGLDPQSLASVEVALAESVGPLATVMVRRAAQQAADLDELCRMLAQEVSEGEPRRAFLKRVSRYCHVPALSPQDRSQDRAHATEKGNLSRTLDQVFRWDDAVLSLAEQRLAKYIGPMAKVLVNRAAAETKGVRQLYQRLSESLDNPRDQADFLSSLDNKR